MITQKELKKILHYDPATGEFTWLLREVNDRGDAIFNAKYAGKKAQGTNADGYITIPILIGENKDRRYMLGHRLAWLYMHGRLPNGGLDHINRNKTDNRIENLQQADQSENMKNLPKMKSNKSGVTGVSWNRKCNRWYSTIRLHRKLIHLYSGPSLFEAACARRSAEKALGFNPNHGR